MGYATLSCGPVGVAGDADWAAAVSGDAEAATHPARDHLDFRMLRR